MTGEPVIEVLRTAADALAVDLAAWEARDPGDPSPESTTGAEGRDRHGGRGDHRDLPAAGTAGRWPAVSGAEAGRPSASAATVKLRLAGSRRGCAEAARRLYQLFYVASVSQPYPEAGSSRLVMVYIKVRLDLRPAPPPAAAAGGPQ